MKKTDRTNEVNISNEGYLIKIVEYNNYDDVWIEFQDEYKIRVHTTYKHFKNGGVKNPYHKVMYNIGYFGQNKYSRKTHPKIYDTWHDMLKRCYNPYYINKHLTYIDCYVCEEWHNFQNFAKWYEENYYEVENQRVHLDKDILNKGNKIYSPETCIFVPQRINVLFTKSDNKRGKYPIGVSYYSKDKALYVNCSIIENDNKKQKYLGIFSINEPYQAFTCYKNFKEKYIKQIADEYKELIPIELYEAMYRYEVEIND